jgi:hypothetical protein
MTVSIADVAESAVTIETCAQVAARFPDAVAHDREKNPFIGWTTVPATLRMYRLRNVVLDRSLMVLMKDGEVIEETVYVQSAVDVAALRVRQENLVVADHGHAVATCCDHWDANYYHWVAHALPALHAILERHDGGDVGLLLPRLSPWQRLSLDMMGASGLTTVTMEPGAQYFIPAMEYYDFVAGRADFALSAVSHAAHARMGAGAAAGDATQRLIYIDRGGSANRRLPNEAALVERLRRRGFHTLPCSKGRTWWSGNSAPGLPISRSASPERSSTNWCPNTTGTRASWPCRCRATCSIGAICSPPASRAAIIQAAGAPTSTSIMSCVGSTNSRY